jgi:hypothetical protein
MTTWPVGSAPAGTNAGVADELALALTPLVGGELPADLKGRLHSPGRDREAIHHHYDLSNDFDQVVDLVGAEVRREAWS